MKETVRTVETAHINLTTQEGEFTRPSAAILSAVYLARQEQVINANSINDCCFDNFYFTLSGNKTRGTSKNAGNGKLDVRLAKYLNKCKHLFKYNRFSQQLKFTPLGESKLLKKKRLIVSQETLKRLSETITFKSRKSVLTRADRKKISHQLVNHLN